MAAYTRFARAEVSTTEEEELRTVDELARRLSHFLADEASSISSAHVHGAGSADIQSIVARLLTQELEFGQEIVLTAETGYTTSVRPDFFYPLSAGRGVLAEVERGGTTTNNHDLKDFWKTHLAPDAHHLFLVVPISNWSASGRPRERPFRLVSRRLAAFFGDSRREVDVLSTHVFGYGELTRPLADDATAT